MIDGNQIPTAAASTDEPLLPLGKAFQQIAGRRFDPNVLARWRQRGACGVPLQTTRREGQHLVTPSAARDFLQAVREARHAG
jgi:hypothetical protein